MLKKNSNSVVNIYDTFFSRYINKIEEEMVSNGVKTKGNSVKGNLK